MAGREGEGNDAARFEAASKDDAHDTSAFQNPPSTLNSHPLRPSLEHLQVHTVSAQHTERCMVPALEP